MILSLKYSSKISLSAVAFFTFFLLSNFQNLTIFGWNDPQIDIPIKLYHVAGLLIFMLFLLTRFRNTWFFNHVFFFLIWIFLISAIMSPFYGLNRILVNYFFGGVSFLMGVYFASRINEEKVLNILRSAIWIMIIAIIIKDIYHIESFIKFFRSPRGHPIVFSLYGGGLNLEASWIAISSVFFYPRKKSFYFVILFAIFLSIIYSSRAGFVLGGVSFIGYLVSPYSRPTEVVKLAILGILSTILVITMTDANFLFIFQRFSTIGEDAGSLGRFKLWEYVWSAAKDNYFIGYGAGNSIMAISQDTEIIRNDNLHNYYLQLVIEFGIIGLAVYLLLQVRVLLTVIDSNLRDTLGIWLLICFIGMLVQFRGTAAHLWLIFGLIAGRYHKHANINNNHSPSTT